MKLGTKGRYAVMALVDLADSPLDQPKTLAEIAASQSISLSYLDQLFAKMRRRGVVKSVRGPGGGPPWINPDWRPCSRVKASRIRPVSPNRRLPRTMPVSRHSIIGFARC